MSQNQVKLGEVCESEPDRKKDAIHVAIAYVEAGEALVAGQRVGLTYAGSGIVDSRSKTPIGVVDPFIEGTVLAGDSFWLFLFPDSITGLRHEWEHPQFPTPQPTQDREDYYSSSYDDECRGCNN